ncbi:MAG: glutathione-disulfide reductase [Rhodoferax sp.]|nr:glutathione-disulfide reductase [Rhodoferax sp.]
MTSPVTAPGFDLLVIGGGSGGVRAARIAAGHGARVALVEQHRLGGTCVIRGCVPKKLMVYAARFAQEFEEAQGFGWTLGEPQFDWTTLKRRRDAEVARLEEVYRQGLVSAGVDIFQGQARFLDRQTVELSDGRKLTAAHVLIATGAHPTGGEDTPGQELAINSDGFFELESLPGRVVVQGAGYIAVELACLLKLLGAEVDVVVRGEGILRNFDVDVRQHLGKALADLGLNFHYGRRIIAIGKTFSALRVALDDGRRLEADCVLRALGRAPHTHGLALERLLPLGLEINTQGAIAVDAYSQTGVPGIYAVGDVTNRVNLTPMAIREGHAFADSVFGGKPRSVDHHLVPTAVFTTPEVGVVGLTEAQALAQYPNLDVYRSVFRPLKSALSGQAGKNTGKMMLKLLVDRDTDRVLGFHGVGPDTGEMAQLMGVALQLRATKSALDATLAVHPTAAEELVTMRTPAVRYGLA